MSDDPPNAGTPLSSQTGEPHATTQVYVRSNFPVPTIDEGAWHVSVGRSEISLSDLNRYEKHSVVMALECAGNGRTLMVPTPPGTPWTLGGASHVEFSGVRLRDVLSDHLPLEGAVEVVFTGADSGVVPEDGQVPYQFSLTTDEAQSSDPLLVWEMNGEPLTAEHGSPIRLVVPGQYAMKSVKWLTSIQAADEPFLGHFVRKYRYFADATESEAAPVGAIQVRSLVAEPLA
ncbi:MAG: molybdopterin-dependent oxidoreductase, partial [Acidimicrobiia bacterium]